MGEDYATGFNPLPIILLSLGGPVPTFIGRPVVQNKYY